MARHAGHRRRSHVRRREWPSQARTAAAPCRTARFRHQTANPRRVHIRWLVCPGPFVAQTRQLSRRGQTALAMLTGPAAPLWPQPGHQIPAIRNMIGRFMNPRSRLPDRLPTRFRPQSISPRRRSHRKAGTLHSQPWPQARRSAMQVRLAPAARRSLVMRKRRQTRKAGIRTPTDR